MSELSETIKKRTFTVMDTPTLVRANQKAVELGQNRSVTEEFINMLDSNGTHVVTFTMDHVNFEGTPGVRCQIYCKVKRRQEPVAVWIDITHKEFLALPTVTTEEVEKEVATLKKLQ